MRKVRQSSNKEDQEVSEMKAIVERYLKSLSKEQRDVLARIIAYLISVFYLIALLLQED